MAYICAIQVDYNTNTLNDLDTLSQSQDRSFKISSGPGIKEIHLFHRFLFPSSVKLNLVSLQLA